MNFAICNEIFQDWKIEDIFAYGAKLGYSAIEIAPFTLANSVTEVSTADRNRIRDEAARKGIAIAGIHWVLVKPEGLYINHPDSKIRETTARYLRELVDFCADLGGTVMVVGSPKQRNILAGVSPEQASEWAIQTFKDAIHQAEERKITICFEPLSPIDTNFINTAQEALQFIKRVQSPSFQIILDVKAMCSESKPIPQIISESWPHFAHFHANDKNLKGPGFGDVKFEPIAQALKQVNYNRYVSVEVFNFEEGAETIARKSIEYLQNVFRD